MNTGQQDDTRRYFHDFAEDWRRKGSGEIAARVNIIAQRNQVALDALAGLKAPRRVLDIGCGTGDLALDVGRRGVEAVGIDFAADMIRICEEARAAAKLENVRFEHVSMFDFDPRGAKFDLISAQGLIEYISSEQLDALCRKVFEMLAPGGAFIVGSRNRLFNVVSLNAFTAVERELGNLDDLAREAQACATAPGQAEAIAAMERLARAYPQPDRHPTTGVAVSVRYQYSPGELAGRLRRFGLAPHAIAGAHYHGLPPVVAAEWPALHASLADTIYRERRDDIRLLPYCSTFVLDARRPV